jgi:hypothetical protein
VDRRLPAGRLLAKSWGIMPGHGVKHRRETQRESPGRAIGHARCMAEATDKKVHVHKYSSNIDKYA